MKVTDCVVCAILLAIHQKSQKDLESESGMIWGGQLKITRLLIPAVISKFYITR